MSYALHPLGHVRMKVSLFAGIFSVSNEKRVPSLETLERAVKPGAHFTVHTYSDSHLTILHGDLGVLPEKGWLHRGDTVAALAGSLHLNESPTLAEEGSSQPELSAMAASLKSQRTEDLCEANGTFALCVYDVDSHRLTLAGDSIGGRPVYYCLCSGLLFFSTSIRVLERLEGVPKISELASYIEQEAICYPLGARTVYRDIKVLVASEALKAGHGRVEAVRYFDWAKLPSADEPVEELARTCRQALRQAVACRAITGAAQTSLLSGGLDSRVIIAELLDLGYKVKAVNLAPEGYQDQLYARRFAEVAGVPLSSKSWSPGIKGASAGEIGAAFLEAALSGLAPGPVFSGDGGGETFGFLLMNARAAELIGQGKLRAAVDEYLRKYHVARVFTTGVYAQLKTAANDRMQRALSEVGALSPEKDLHVFVLCNDLRCHLHEYFNRLPDAQVELLLPFYDRRVLASVLRIPPPLHPLMSHVFYNSLIPLLPPVITDAPWQTYPGHAPCPVADPTPPTNQWAKTKLIRDDLAKQCWKAVLSPGFAPVLRRSVVLMALILHRARLADYTYLFQTCINLNRLCGGNRSYVVRDEDTSLAPVHVPASRIERPDERGSKPLSQVAGKKPQ